MTRYYTELPNDEQVSNWYTENIDADCSASSAIYKFRLWLKSLPTPASKVEGKTVEEIKESARIYAESQMSKAYGENWDRKDHIAIGIFYKHYIDYVMSVCRAQSQPAMKWVRVEDRKPENNWTGCMKGKIGYYTVKFKDGCFWFGNTDILYTSDKNDEWLDEPPTT